MLKYAKKSELGNAIISERKLIDSYKSYAQGMKEAIKNYMNESKNVSFDNDTLKTMLFNNFDNATVQLDNNLQDIESLNNVLEILSTQKSVTTNDTETYNKLAQKCINNLELTHNFIEQTVGCFENVNITGKKKALDTIKECKKIILKDFPFSNTTVESKVIESSNKKAETSKTVQKKIDYSSSDLLCFFPKSKNDNLVISTIQNNYKISFVNKVASIYIQDENFNISLVTPGVQISNSNTNNILFVSYTDSKYTIITNNQIEIPFFIHVSKVNKNEDFLEVEITRDSLVLSVEDNILNFEESENNDSISNSNGNIIVEPDEDSKTDEVDSVENDNEESIIDVAEENNIIETSKSIESKENIPSKEEVKGKHTKATKQKNEPITQNQSDVILPGLSKDEAISPTLDDNDISDNDTLIISDANKTVILPYKITDLRKKMQKNKNYHTLKDVVDKEYTIPIETFKNPVKSRFREAFQLIKNKEHGSLKEAVGLGFELMFQSNLTPAVIAACKDLDELDIYLDCLDDNELEKFSCFKISYSVPPTK